MTDLTPAAIAEALIEDLKRQCTDALVNDGVVWLGGGICISALDLADALAPILTAARDAARYREALELIWPFFEGEHYYDHPDSVKVRAALAGEREG